MTFFAQKILNYKNLRATSQLHIPYYDIFLFTTIELEIRVWKNLEIIGLKE